MVIKGDTASALIVGTHAFESLCFHLRNLTTERSARWKEGKWHKMAMGSAPGGSLTLGIMPTHIPEIGVNKPSNYELLSPTFKSFQQRSWASYNWDHSYAARAQPSQPLSEFSTHQIHERSTICFKTLSFGVPSCVAIVSHLKYRSYFMEKKESSKGITKNQRAEATASENCF